MCWTWISFLVLFSHALLIASDVNLKLCHPSKPIREFSLKKPVTCTKRPAQKISVCKDSDVFQVLSYSVPIQSYQCMFEETSFSTVHWFFGSKTEDVTSYLVDPPDRYVCHLWALTKKDSTLGILKQTDPHMWNTDLQVQLKYVWPTSATGKVRNAILTSTTIHYDSFNHKLVGPFPGISSCDIRKGYCLLGNQMLTWEFDKKELCPVTHLHSVTLKYFAEESTFPFRLELVELGISIHNFGACPETVQACLGNQLYCTDSGFIIRYEKSCKSGLTDSLPVVNLSSSHISEMETALTGYIQEVADITALSFRKINTDLAFLECKLENFVLELSRILSRQYPGPILSSILHQPIGSHSAVMTGDIITEILCEDISAIVRPSLKYGDAYSTRPIVDFVYKNESTFGQVMYDNQVFLGIHYLERYQRGKTSIFEIDGHNYLFRDYALSHDDVDIEAIGVWLARFENDYKTPKFATLINNLPFDENRDDALNTYLALTHLNMIKSDLINNHFSTSQEFNHEINATFIRAYTEGHIRSAIRSMIDFISHPIIGAFYALFIHIAMLWGVILSIMVIRMIIPSLWNRLKTSKSRLNDFKKNYRNRIRSNGDKNGYSDEVIELNDIPPTGPHAIRPRRIYKGSQPSLA